MAESAPVHSGLSPHMQKNTDFHDSLESKSKSTTPQEKGRLYIQDDYQYNAEDRRHRQYFMPQAYPPPAKSRSNQASQVKELKPRLSKESLEMPTSSAPALLASSPKARF